MINGTQYYDFTSDNSVTAPAVLSEEEAQKAKEKARSLAMAICGRAKGATHAEQLADATELLQAFGLLPYKPGTSKKRSQQQDKAHAGAAA